MAGKKNLKKRIGHKVEETWYFILYKAVYIAGLAVLIPMVFAFAFREQGPWYSKPLTYFFASLFLILFAFFGMLKRKKRLSSTLQSLGRMSLIPGIIALIFVIFGRSLVYNFLRIFIPKFESFEPFVRLFIESSIPRVGILILGYIIVGAVLYYLGYRIRK